PGVRGPQGGLSRRNQTRRAGEEPLRGGGSLRPRAGYGAPHQSLGLGDRIPSRLRFQRRAGEPVARARERAHGGERQRLADTAVNRVPGGAGTRWSEQGSVQTFGANVVVGEARRGGEAQQGGAIRGTVPEPGVPCRGHRGRAVVFDRACRNSDEGTWLACRAAL